MSDTILEVDLGTSSIPKPTENNIARRGPRRLVKLIPIPGSASPAIWTGPMFEDEIDGQRVIVRACVVLVSKEPPETMKVTVPADFYDKLPDVPVEW
jgi:hypothetical protein